MHIWVDEAPSLPPHPAIPFFVFFLRWLPLIDFVCESRALQAALSVALHLLLPVKMKPRHLHAKKEIFHFRSFLFDPDCVCGWMGLGDVGWN